MKLKGKVALVTGSAQGIGKEIAVALAKEGADIVISDINVDLSKQTADVIGKLGVKTMSVKLDVSKSAEVNSAVTEIVKTMGGIDILINNAGITKDGLLMRMKEEDWNAYEWCHLFRRASPGNRYEQVRERNVEWHDYKDTDAPKRTVNPPKIKAP